ncbi:1-(5-Phosphoribosyl)-5-amino-4-imidazole-carboxylate (AIR) carboxylase domain protein [mine drainage metagenome]|uniref:1-(5-Phosphoribosyl)-5-amino-4-imidazole-carboxylate (AIR) carboxylase domain protein n=1 Tax=mine drainage metagenome TaxID=410659 RepID=T1B356_9ZZZZ
MPYGIPVATVAINGAKNAAILAIRILSIDDKGLSNKLKLFMETQKKGVMEDKI